MLNVLIIKNFALIESLEIEFSKGFSIITGETGAGKSILLDALALLQGKRADMNSLKNPSFNCVVEGHFFIKDYGLQELFLTLNLEYEDNTIIRREILPSGKSRAFINDCVVKLTDLQAISSKLLHIHSQHQTNDLVEEDTQIALLDTIAINDHLVTSYKAKLREFRALNKELDDLKTQQAELIKESDYISFLLSELKEVELESINQEELEQRLQQLSNVELIRESFSNAISLLTVENVGIIPNLNEVKSMIQKTSFVSKEYEELLSRIISLQIELGDISDTIEDLGDKVVLEPEEIEVIQTKLQLLYSLQRKHQVSTVEELLKIRDNLSNKTFLVSTIEQSILDKEEEKQLLLSGILSLSQEIGKRRKEVVPDLTEALGSILSLVGMPNAQFKFNFIESESLLPSGGDHLELLLAANKGLSFGLLKKVASGGELSRIMLAINAILVKHSMLPTLIFDEIDTGVSGEVADKMGETMKSISDTVQVFAITHLPQVAAQGDVHYKVTKKSDDLTTTSTLLKLDKESRLNEIAQMLSGENITSSALKHAKELLKVKK